MGRPEYVPTEKTLAQPEGVRTATIASRFHLSLGIRHCDGCGQSRTQLKRFPRSPVRTQGRQHVSRRRWMTANIARCGQCAQTAAASQQPRANGTSPSTSPPCREQSGVAPRGKASLAIVAALGGCDIHPARFLSSLSSDAPRSCREHCWSPRAGEQCSMNSQVYETLLRCGVLYAHELSGHAHEPVCLSI